MICDKVGECGRKTCYREKEYSGREKKGKKKKYKKNKYSEKDISILTLSKPPCGNIQNQKRCIKFLDNRSKPKCEENGKSYILDQSQVYPRYEVMELRIDKGVISEPEASTGIKCDFALLVRDDYVEQKRKGTAILVELKGVEIRHALKQLLATLGQKELQALWDEHARVFGRIICKESVPRIRSTEVYADALEAFLRRNGNLKIFEETKTEIYGELECI